ncbi:MAG: hypothetical protein L6R28_03805 [Planctomycetes bacterium]|nr:hypothetical protein [Planctomycetota bacterium]
MSLQDWAKNGWLKAHRSSPKEIEGLLSIVNRDIKDATDGGISEDWKFGIAYNAALKLCAILLHASGYKAENTLQHFRTIQAMPLILGDKRKGDAQYLDDCRKKRNKVEYDVAGAASAQDASELLEFSKELRADVLDWLKNQHPELL